MSKFISSTLLAYSLCVSLACHLPCTTFTLLLPWKMCTFVTQRLGFSIFVFLLCVNPACSCNPLGTLSAGNPCDIQTGSCYCKRLVTGQNCEKCLVREHYKYVCLGFGFLCLCITHFSLSASALGSQ